MNEYLLIDGTQIPVLAELAQIIGLNDAIVLQQVHSWCRTNKKYKKNFRDGYYWVYNSYREWTENHFPWWTDRTVKEIFSRLEKKGLVISGNFNKSAMDRTKWYRVNYPVLKETILSSPLGKNFTMDWEGLSQPIPHYSHIGNNGSFPPSMVEKERSSFVSNLDIPADLPGFIAWYFDYYQDTLNKPHPRISADQRGRVAATLSEFMEQQSVDIEGLQIMAEAFFQNVTDSDYNINHFATSGILKNRFYETLR